jgi:hypothetical protein
MLLGVGLAALTLAACGSDKSSDKTAASTTRSVAGATGTTGAGGAGGASGTTGASPLSSTPGAGKKRASGGSTAPSGGNSAKPAPSTPTDTQNSTPHSPPKKKPAFVPGSFAGQAKELYKQSKEVCKYLTLDGLAREYNVTPKTPEAVARRYSKAYPKNARDAVYRGCKAGLS